LPEEQWIDMQEGSPLIQDISEIMMFYKIEKPVQYLQNEENV
jgi:hypothetical protein